MKTCLYRMFGECKNCIPDYNPQSHPNNSDCRNYHEVSLLIFEVQKENKEKESIDSIVKILEKK